MFRGGDPIELIEVAPGIDVERDVIALMGFRPAVARDLREMDAALFRPEPLGLRLSPTESRSGHSR